MSAAREAKIPGNQESIRTLTSRIEMNKDVEEEEGFTGEVMEERDLDGAADDGVDPKPPSSAEHSTGESRPHYLPY